MLQIDTIELAFKSQLGLPAFLFPGDEDWFDVSAKVGVKSTKLAGDKR